MGLKSIADNQMEIISKEIQSFLKKVISERLSADIKSIDFKLSEDADGDEILEVIVTFSVEPASWTTGGMFDMVAAASEAMQQKGIEQTPYFRTKFGDAALTGAV
ncbi:MAG: hypothetical protein AAF723_01175 [Pseudomonadota bacterium]